MDTFDFMNFIKRFSLATLSGVLMVLSWQYIGNLPFLFFIAFIPMFFLFDDLIQQNKNSIQAYLYAFWIFFLYNLGVTWWIYFASGPGMLMAVLLNTFFMAFIPFWYYGARKRLGLWKGFFAFILFILAFEWLHYHWEFSWPWLNLGNVFANQIKWIQWYEYTGVLGGSLWILLINALLYLSIKRLLTKQKFLIHLLSAILLVIIPLLISFKMYNAYEESGKQVEVVVVQPNIDPYNEKFDGLSDEQQVDRLINLGLKEISVETDFLVAPETALPSGYWENEIKTYFWYDRFKALTDTFPNLNIVSGLSSYQAYENFSKAPSPTARPFNDGSGWYDAYNSSILINNANEGEIYHKSKLVLGVERLPFAWLLKPLENFALDLGGTVGSLGTQKEPTVFQSNNHVNFGTAICYESGYGEYFSDFVKKGAEIMFVITNDGWWEDTPGYKQHLSFSKLRAIETRRSIARSANTGISAFINQKGEILKSTNWWEQAVIKSKLYLNNKQTFYTKHGDMIGRIASFLAVLMLLYSWVLKYKSNLI